MKLSLYEIQHGDGPLTVRDWIIAHSDSEAITMLEDALEAVVCERQSFQHCKVTRIPEDMQVMTVKGLMTVQQVIEHYNQPYYVKSE